MRRGGHHGAGSCLGDTAVELESACLFPHLLFCASVPYAVPCNSEDLINPRAFGTSGLLRQDKVQVFGGLLVVTVLSVHA